MSLAGSFKPRGCVSMLSLFECFPRLPDKLPRVPLGDFPTPVEKLNRLGAVIRAARLYVKRDDLSGRRRGSNGHRPRPWAV